jgi:cytochrome c oxidase subunit 4
MAGPTGAVEGHGGPGQESHVRTYVTVGVILAILTAAEVAVFYIDALKPVLVPLLLIMSAAKFVLVVQYYMHLKWDHPLFSRVFYGPMAVAIVFVIIGLLALFKFLPRFDQY